jgi:hypothetical protein
MAAKRHMTSPAAAAAAAPAAAVVVVPPAAAAAAATAAAPPVAAVDMPHSPKPAHGCQTANGLAPRGPPVRPWIRAHQW